MIPPTDSANRYSPSDLLGPLNDVERKHAPEWFFAAGETALLRGGIRVSIVGARKCTLPGWRRAKKLASQLVKEGITIVSGLAEGIDTAAHQATIEARGKTIAVLGTPLDRVYPQANRQLQHEIMANHLAVSIFSPGSRVFPSNFPKRNRIMALISDATVIVEAGETSGTIHQGWEALRLGRLLFLPKSLVEDTSLAWPGKMLRHGAQVLTDSSSITTLLPTAPDQRLESVAF